MYVSRFQRAQPMQTLLNAIVCVTDGDAARMGNSNTHAQWNRPAGWLAGLLE